MKEWKNIRKLCLSNKVEVVKSEIKTILLSELKRNDNEIIKYACITGHSEILTILFEAGLTIKDACANDSEGFRMACFNKHLDIVQILSKHGLRREHLESNKKEIFRYNWMHPFIHSFYQQQQKKNSLYKT